MELDDLLDEEFHQFLGIDGGVAGTEVSLFAESVNNDADGVIILRGQEAGDKVD